MKKSTLLAIVIACFSLACGSQSSKPGISGTLKGAEGKSIYLERFVNDRAVRTDSTTIGANGKFLIVPAQPLDLNFYRLIIDNDHYAVIITDSTENLDLNAEYENMKMGASFSGSDHSEVLSEFYKIMEPYAKKINDLKSKATQAGVSSEAIAEMKAQYQEIVSEKNVKAKEWLEANSKSPAALAALNELDIRTEFDLYKKVRDDLKPTFAHSFYYREVSRRIDATENAPKTMPGGMDQAQPGDPRMTQGQQQPPARPIRIGAPAPDIADADPNGKVRKLSDMKGKVVLIDFWASWCGPCRKENPALVAAYNKYNKDGFEVLSVSLDNDASRWKDAIAKDGLTWDTHVSDLKGWQSKHAAAYGVHSIPFPVLVGKDGNVINFGQNVRGPFLEQELHKQFGH